MKVDQRVKTSDGRRGTIIDLGIPPLIKVRWDDGEILWVWDSAVEVAG